MTLQQEDYTFLTRDQHIRFLIDQALFSDSPSARTRAVTQLARRYREIAIPTIEEIIATLPNTDQEFRAYCTNLIARIKKQ